MNGSMQQAVAVGSNRRTIHSMMAPRRRRCLNSMTTDSMVTLSFTVGLLMATFNCPRSFAIQEVDRMKEYDRRGYQWPPRRDEYHPNTEGWRRLHERRFRQIDHSTTTANGADIYSAYIVSIHSAMMVPNFTEMGWGLTTAPRHVWEPLHEALTKAIEGDELRYEDFEPAINTTVKLDTNDQFQPTHSDDLSLQLRSSSASEAADTTATTATAAEVVDDRSSDQLQDQDVDPLRPLFFWNQRMRELRDFALNELQPLVEAWAGVPVEPAMAYGLRVYQNTSRLYMHVDTPNTHVISAIFHIYHDEDSRPWPLVIEGFDGNTYAAPLNEGEILLYESSKCFHGRPMEFHGKHYSSLFLHYTPIGYAEQYEQRVQENVMYRVPPQWAQSADERRRLRINLDATSRKRDSPDNAHDVPQRDGHGEDSGTHEDRKEQREGPAHVDEYTFIETFAKETGCEHEWCSLGNAVWLNGDETNRAPPYGQVLSGYGKSARIRHIFEEQRWDDEDDEENDDADEEDEVNDSDEDDNDADDDDEEEL